MDHSPEIFIYLREQLPGVFVDSAVCCRTEDEVLQHHGLSGTSEVVYCAVTLPKDLGSY